MKRQDLDNLLSRFDDDALSPRERQQLARELADNPDAQKLRAQYQRLNDVLERLPHTEPALDFSALRQNILAQSAKDALYPAVKALPWRRWTAAVAVAAMLAVAFIAWQVLPQTNSITPVPAPDPIVQANSIESIPTAGPDEPVVVVQLAAMPTDAESQSPSAESAAPTLVLCWGGDKTKPDKISNGKDQATDDFSKWFF